jgi:hypothetical protein
MRTAFEVHQVEDVGVSGAAPETDLDDILGGWWESDRDKRTPCEVGDSRACNASFRILIDVQGSFEQSVSPAQSLHMLL